MTVEKTRHDLDRLKRLNEREASVDRRLSLDEVEAMMSFDWSCTNELLGTPEIQRASDIDSESGDATDAQGDAQNVPIMEDAAIEQDSEDKDSASD